MSGWDVHAHLLPAGVAHTIPELSDPAALTRWLDDVGLDGAVVSPPPPALHVDLGPRESAVWSRELNDGIERVVAFDPRRLRAFAYLPISDPPEAVKEFLRRREGPWAGAVIPTSAPGRTLADPQLDTLWSTLNTARAFVFVHPVDIRDERFGQFYLRNLLGNPTETALAAACLIFSGILERFPAIRFCLSHAGGAVPALAGRWQRGRETNRPGIPQAGAPPREALRLLYADCLAHSPAALDLALDVFGADHVILGTDWPFPMGSLDPDALLVGLSHEARFAVRESNLRSALTRPG